MFIQGPICPGEETKMDRALANWNRVQGRAMAPTGSWTGNWNQKSWLRTVRQMDHMWWLVIGDYSSTLLGTPKGRFFLARNTAHGTWDSFQLPLHSREGSTCIASIVSHWFRQNEPTDLAIPVFLLWRACFLLYLLIYPEMPLSYIYSLQSSFMQHCLMWSLMPAYKDE